MLETSSPPLQERHAVLGDEHAARLQASLAAGVEFRAEEHLAGPDRIGGIDQDDVEAPIRLGNELHAVGDHQVEARIVEDGGVEAAKMLTRELHHRGVDLDLGQPFHALVLQRLLGHAAIAAADDQHLARRAVGEDRHMGHHLVVDELVAGGDLHHPVEH